MTPQVIGELREKMLAQILDEMATDFDEVAHVVGDFWDRARQVTIRGMIAALTNNARLLGPDLDLPEDSADQTALVDADSAGAEEGSHEVTIHQPAATSTAMQQSPQPHNRHRAQH